MGLTTCPRRQILIVLLLLLSAASALPQSEEYISAITGKIRYAEEIYVRTDRDIYIVGEEVYLKVFCFSSLTRGASGISDVAYVSLLDRSNHNILQIKIRINGLSGSGYFTIPELTEHGELLHSHMHALDEKLIAGTLLL